MSIFLENEFWMDLSGLLMTSLTSPETLAPHASAGGAQRSLSLSSQSFGDLSGTVRPGGVRHSIHFVSPSVSALWAEMRCAKKIGRKVSRMTNIATTLVTGRSRGRVSCEKIQIGSVVCWPAVKVVTI